ncbi:hypothetical protein GDO78_020845 [Eleutherodactylus coqui]|uniref:Uncharacterized protein n=1 Tax=Eleutherodactylus coqui TaxID=57060 RepID=A0A8J6C218_ELECQ|nr:hypothetical protein GDO78_020845 [Eleutherodactylus coqui]
MGSLKSKHWVINSLTGDLLLIYQSAETQCNILGSRTSSCAYSSWFTANCRAAPVLVTCSNMYACITHSRHALSPVQATVCYTN